LLEYSEKDTPSVEEKNELLTEIPSVLTQNFKNNLKALGTPYESKRNN
jgi:hypothetical protein